MAIESSGKTLLWILVIVLIVIGIIICLLAQTFRSFDSFEISGWAMKAYNTSMVIGIVVAAISSIPGFILIRNKL